MGANAQTSVPTFTAGDVLTAANMNISARTGVPVFADTTARDAAFGGTGEKTLAEGQLCYVENLSGLAQLQYYDGAAWASVTTSGIGLVVVKAETTFTTAASVTADNVFSATYSNYLINVRYVTSSTNDFTLRLRVGGVSAATNYNYQQNSGDGTSSAAARSTSQTSFIGGGNTNGTFYSHSQFTLFNPAVAEATTITHINNQNAGAYTNPVNKIHTGNHSTATAYDGFELLIAGGHTITGAYTVYGYGKSL